MYLKSMRILEERIHLALEWKASGLTQIDFAKLKGMDLSDLRYQLRYVREKFPEVINDSDSVETLFIPIPPELINDPDSTETPSVSTKDPVLTIQFNSISIYASNQINPSLLKTVIDVVLSC